MTAETISTVSPATNKVILERRGTSIEEATQVAKVAEKAFQSWRGTSLSERKVIVGKALALVQERKVKLGEELTLQIGRPIAYSVNEIETMQKRADYLMQTAEESLKDLPGTLEDGFTRYISKEPVGPVLIVSAWNFPYLIIVNSLVPALLSGNSILLKPSPQTPLIGQGLVEIFREAGLPNGVLQVVYSGSVEMLTELVKFPEIKMISFTGSTSMGLALREATARRFIPLNLELGGNDPAYVRPDADLKYVAEQLVDGAVFNSGQSCCAVERIYVHADVYDAFIKAVQAEISGYKLGDPSNSSTNIGPVISRAAQENIIAQIEDALAKGANDATPANATFTSAPIEGNYVIPRILIDVTHDMTIMSEETFGPVLPIMKVSSDAEAITLMNDSDYGLTASVWTRDIARGKELISQLEAGTVFVNRCDYPNPDLAWTGWKNSGLGCTLGPRGFDAFVKLKSYHVKHKHG